jgi:hypothetical protein
MSNPVQLNSVHCRAICEEIGEWLGKVFNPETGHLPARLQVLIDRLADLDREPVPSIAPNLGDMI